MMESYLIGPVIDAAASIAAITGVKIFHGVWYSRILPGVRIIFAAPGARLSVTTATHTSHMIYDGIHIDPANMIAFTSLISSLASVELFLVVDYYRASSGKQ